MGRGEQADLNQNANIGRGLSTQFGAQANNTLSTLAPTLTAEATDPQGFAPNDLAAMNTANNDSVGGSQAGAIGQGNLMAARTRNAGAFAPALDESARVGGRTLAHGALEIQGQNADLREKHRQQGISGLQSLYGGLTDDQLKALGLSTGAFSAAANPGNQPFTTSFTTGLGKNITGGNLAPGGG